LSYTGVGVPLQEAYESFATARELRKRRSLS